jgi:glucosamine--fructose-6-phosphate aminotransferase (isomerizing)
MFLQNEINEQSSIIVRLLNEQTHNIRTIAKAILEYNPVFVCLAARGTSDNAALYAKYLFGAYLGLPMMLATPSLHTLYKRPPNLNKGVVIGISQSGRAEDVRQVLEDARRQGALTIAITNYDDSPMAQTAQYHIPIMAGEEVSIAATKTYTAQLTVIAMLIAELSGQSELHNDLTHLPRYAQYTLDQASHVGEWAERYRYMSQLAVIGRGYNNATALEISLKVKELCYINTNGYSEADFRHGPIATIQTGFPVMLVAPKGYTLDYMHDLTKKLTEKEAECLIISNDDEMLALGKNKMVLPDVPEWLSPIVAVMPGQVFAMQQALNRGYAVDKPRGLSKVTVTK